MSTSIRSIIIPHVLLGRIRCSVIKLDGRRRLLTTWQKNIILDSGLNLLAASSSYLDFCHIGESDIEPDSQQTTLLSPLVSTGNRLAAQSVTSNIAPYSGVSTITYRFPAGAVSGFVKEFGFGPSANLGSPLFNRALIRNSDGTPVSINVQPDEAFDVEYEFIVKAPSTDFVGSTFLDGEEIGYVARPALISNTGYWCPYRAESFASAGQAVRANFSEIADSHIQAFDGGLGNVIGIPMGASENATYINNLQYSPGDFNARAIAEWGIDNAMFDTGIRSLLWSFRTSSGSGGNSFGAYQLEFDTPILKTNRESFMIELGIGWNRE